MPRSKPSKALPFFYSRGRKLSSTARDELVDLLGYGKLDLLGAPVRRQLPDLNPQDPTDGKDPGKIILAIETALGVYADGYTHLDDIPRPAD